MRFVLSRSEFRLSPSAVNRLGRLTIPTLSLSHRYLRLPSLSTIPYFVSNSIGLAQDNPLPQPSSAVTTRVTALSSIELWLAGAIIIFGLVVLSMQFLLLKRASHTQPEDILRLFTVTIIIVGTLALIAVGYSSQQIAPALGLFGTILGYLLGKTDERRRTQERLTAGMEEPRR
jgi:hypothetical protein